jgi:DNA-binding GntR family transcriptional regulator
MPARRAPAPSHNGRRPLLRDDVHAKIKHAILTCALAPGTKIHEQDLALAHKVSKSPIRDALLRLQSEELVEVLPRKGYRVRPVSLVDALDLYDMRLVLEEACVERVIEHASDAELRSLDAYRHAPPAADLAAWIDYNRQFHIAVASLCGNRRLLRTLTEHIHAFDRLTYTGVAGLAGLAGSRVMQKFAAEHRRLIDALKARDARKASALIRAHIQGSRKRMVAAAGEPRLIERSRRNACASEPRKR